VKFASNFCVDFADLSDFQSRKSHDFEENGDNSDDWTISEGFKKAESETYPRRVLGSGTRASLVVVLRQTKAYMDQLCRGAVQGFKVLLHSPNEIPKVATNYFSIPLSQEVIFSVKPSMMTTSPKLQSYDPEIRQCFFEDEKKLQFFKLYTQSNCEIECLANFTLKTCGCVKFSMPRENETKICGHDMLECYNDAEDQLLEAKLKQGLSLTGRTECNCKPSCTSIHYNAEISQTDFNAASYINAIGDPAASATDKFFMSKLKIFFKEPQFITSKRSELYGLSEFLANCGGILGEKL
jgi:acid-sensing ion channel, other